MTATYNPALPTDVDWVRFQIGDRGTFVTPPSGAVTGTSLEDEEITAILAEETNKWFAAAVCGEVIIALGQGAVSKSVGALSISFGDSPTSGYRAHLAYLRQRGSVESIRANLGSGGSILNVLGTKFSEGGSDE